MSRLRRALASVAVLWLCCQAVPLVGAPFVFWLGTPAEQLECTCTHGDHAMCPMHHKRAPGSTLCLMRSADGGDAAALASMFHFAAVLATPAEGVSLPMAGAAITSVVTPTNDRQVLPDPPPPRA